MPIRAVYCEGRFFPSVLCDHCGEKIEEASKANALWDPFSGEAFFVHTPYNRAFESSFEEHLWWEPLDSFLHRVLFNSGFQPKQAREKAEMLGQLP
jgi:hypothetical protein